MTATAAASRDLDRVGWRDLAWVTWRQHRYMISGIGFIVAAGAVAMAMIGITAASTGSIRAEFLVYDGLRGPAQTLTVGLLCFSAVIAAFWSAPLLSREYEQRTHLLVWSQDVTASRWLAGKAVVLATVAVAYAVVLGVAASFMTNSINTVSPPQQGLRLFDELNFGAVPHVQIGYALFGFALGLAASAITRRTVLSIGLTLGIFYLTRAIITNSVMPYYQTPVRLTAPIGTPGPLRRWPTDDLYVESGYLNAAGEKVSYPEPCIASGGTEQHVACMRENGIVSRYRDFQPIERLDTFRWIEFGVYIGLAVVLALVTWRVIRRTTRL